MNSSSIVSDHAAHENLLRILHFLKESNAMENIVRIDYSFADNLKPDEGYFGAFVKSQQLAESHIPLTLNDLCQWQGLITKEQIRYGHSIAPSGIGKIRSLDVPINLTLWSYTSPDFTEVPQLIDELVRDLNLSLEAAKTKDEVMIVSLMGDFYYRFEAIHPFIDANGRTGRLLLNYIASWFSVPLIVVRAEEKKEFFEAHKSKEAMRCFMGKKMKECIFNSQGRILKLTDDSGISARYCNLLLDEEVTIEWGHLLKAMEEWAKAPCSSAPDSAGIDE